MSETNARVAKAIRLADALQAAGCDAADLDTLDHEGWLNAAAVAGCKPPSEETKAVVDQLLADRERTSTDDLFEMTRPVGCPR